ncbi:MULTISPECIES: exodeoxyribonuclease I [Pseudomonas]|uniref:Exodeoxyribonuclease I n=2 Tax=Pseudomonas TaxID=286 RepID=A0ABM7CVI8_9PSED|nr:MULTISPECIES: exodeoxyribonuclease I [Pseudomonas]AZL70479.1 exodeoxyribonuclease I [Pseudomonas oryziphila]AZL75523.1 exodeoxyribonuclease I [Pseudomonas oryziphila]MDZ4020225.1 Exodeoxyribonuclease I [Pseudomonas sichuanensis]UVL88443.1 exodeoxyribonuclease I [Pseudomonas sichuanensis]
MSSSIFWHDYETTGINPRNDRPLQVAGVRTDLDLNEIEAPISLYCRPSDDILPHPAACLVTGITPQQLASQGLCEAEFMTRIHEQLARPGTCGAGYNTLRFDDEVTRYSLYRNFFDPYAREWQGGNSRWDLIDVVRTAYALRPEGIVWPQQEGRTSLRLELLSKANGIDHGHAHEALSDVRATIALARLIREKQPKLYDWLFQLRSKHKVMEQIRLLQPLVHVSGRFSAQRNYIGVVLPLAWHPRNRNALIVCDLGQETSPLLQDSAEVLRQRLYTRREALAEGELPVPLKLVHVNRCPVLAPLSVVRPADQQRLGLDMAQLQKHAEQLASQQAHWRNKLEIIYGEEDFAPCEDPEQQLYDGFIGDRDRRLCEQVRTTDPAQLAKGHWMFDDSRLPELLFRYRARNFADTLDAQEQARWQAFCQQRLSDPAMGAPNTLGDFEKALQSSWAEADEAGKAVLKAWQAHAGQLKAQFQI